MNQHTLVTGHHFRIRGRGRLVPILCCLAVMVAGTLSTECVARANPQGSRSDSLLAHLSLNAKIGQMLMVSVAGQSMTPSLRQFIQTFQPGGITLFGDNFSSTSQLASFVAGLQRASHIPLFISVDQEGGEVIRITSGVKQLPSEATYGAQASASVVRSDCSTEAKQLHNLGINMNLAPVLDVATSSQSIMAQEQRSFGPNSHLDAKLGVAEIRAYQGHGVAATAKHVLGLGTTSTDPESTLPTISLTKSQLSDQLYPFKKAVKAGVDAIMVTHVVVTGITGPTTPASLSHKVVTGILRKQMGYQGVLMTDSLTMGSVTGHFSTKQSARMAVQAGEDVLLIAGGGNVPPGLMTTFRSAISTSVHKGSISTSRIDASVHRILSLKRSLGLHLPGR